MVPGSIRWRRVEARELRSGTLPWSPDAPRGAMARIQVGIEARPRASVFSSVPRPGTGDAPGYAVRRSGIRGAGEGIARGGTGRSE